MKSSSCLHPWHLLTSTLAISLQERPHLLTQTPACRAGRGGGCPLEGRHGACTAGVLLGARLQAHPLQSELSAAVEGTQLWEERHPGLSCGSILKFDFRISVAQLAQGRLWWHPWWLRAKGHACNAGDLQETDFSPWIEKIPWRRKWQPAPIILPGNPRGQRSLAGYSPWDCKELDRTERLNNNREGTCLQGHRVLGRVCAGPPSCGAGWGALLSSRLKYQPQFWVGVSLWCFYEYSGWKTIYNELNLLCLDTTTRRGRRRNFYLQFGKEICIWRIPWFQAKYRPHNANHSVSRWGFSYFGSTKNCK